MNTTNINTIQASALKALLLFAPKNDIRFYLNGILIEPQTGIAVATDGHRLLAVRFGQPDAAAPEPYIIPRESVERALKGSRAGDFVGLTPSQIGDVAYTPVDGTYPTWRRVAPTIDASKGEFFQNDARLYNPRYVLEARDALLMLHGNKLSVPKTAETVVELCCNSDARKAGAGIAVLHDTPVDALCLVMPTRYKANDNAPVASSALAAVGLPS